MADGKDEKDLKNKETEEKAESGAEEVVEPDSTVKNDEPGAEKAPVAVEKAEADSPSKAHVPQRPTVADQNPGLVSLLTRDSGEQRNLPAQNLPAQNLPAQNLPAQNLLAQLLERKDEAQKDENVPAQPSADQPSGSGAPSVSPTKRAAKRGDGSDDDDHPTQPKQLKSPARKPKN